MSMFPILDTNLCVWQVSVWSRNYCDIFNIGLFTPALTSGTHWQKTFKIKMVKFLRKIYRIPSYNCRGNYSFLEVGVRQLFKGWNYSFLNLEIVEIQIVAANFNFLTNKLNFCCENYSRKETIHGNTVTL